MINNLFRLLLALLVAALFVDFQGWQFALFGRLMESFGDYSELVVVTVIGWLLLPWLGWHRE